jgi:D-glycerate 3-kinase
MPKIRIDQFLQKHRLPAEYAFTINEWFLPLAEKLVLEQKIQSKPLIIGINGAQGTGKSTLADLLKTVFEQDEQLTVASLSLDDFYLTHQQRTDLAHTVHPLMATRGVPGTHDIALAIDTIRHLFQLDSETFIPRFDKTNDDRHKQSQWTSVVGAVDIIILEGWCMGAEAQSIEQLSTPVNDLEENEDADRGWRYYINQQLHYSYPSLFSLVDQWIMLKAPSFDCVSNWRLEQEHKLRSSIADPKKTMDDNEIERFIKFYQRITEHLLQTLPGKVDYLFELNSERKINRLIKK